MCTSKERTVDPLALKQHWRLDKLDRKGSQRRMRGDASRDVRADPRSVQKVRRELLDEVEVEITINHISDAILV